MRLLLLLCSLASFISCHASGQDLTAFEGGGDVIALDLSGFDAECLYPLAVAAPGAPRCSPVDLSAFDVDAVALVATTTPLDLSVFDDVIPAAPVEPPKPVAPPKPKPSGQSAKMAPGQSIEVPATADLDYPVRGHWWTHPGVGRGDLIQHLLTGSAHAGEFTRDTLNRLTMAELESLHSDHHEGNVKPITPSGQQPVQIIQDVEPEPVWVADVGRTYFWPSTRRWHTTPQPGMSYYDQATGARIDTTSAAPLPQPTSVRVTTPRLLLQKNCPGRVCPVRRY
jgi:hypothetical protein